MSRTPQPHYIGHRQRIKRKYRTGGLQGWLDHEVLEFALSYALPRRDTKPIAKELLARFKSFGGVLDSDPVKLSEVDGISEHSALFLKFLRDVATYYMKNASGNKDLVSSPQSAVAYLRSALKGAKDESFYALFLDTRNHLLASERLQTGTVNRSVVYPRKIVEKALEHHAVSVIISHNHPGESLTPSDDDIRTTTLIQKALATIEISLLDHIIIAGTGYFSWKENGLL